MKLNILLGILFLSMTSLETTAQTTDLARVEYMYIPFSKSKNSLNRYRALVQAPIPLDKEKDKLFIVGLEYRYVDVNIEDREDIPVFDDHLVASLQQMSIYLGYVFKPTNHWRFGAKFGIRLESDLVGSPLNDDLIYDIGVYAIGDYTDDVADGKKPRRLILGINYATVPGRWYPLPLINYYKEFHPNWSYTLGIPKTNVKYYLNDSHKDAIQAFATLDNVYGNLQNGFVPISPSENPDGKVAESIQETIVLLGLGYEHFFTKHLVFYLYAAHSVYNDLRLEDGDGDKIYKINTENTPYFRTGLKFKL